MTFAAALVVGAVLVAWSAPAVLGRFEESWRDASAGVICWVVTIAGVVATFAVGSVLLLLPGHDHEGPLGQLGHDCWTLMGHHLSHRVQGVVGAAGLAAVVTLLVRFAVASVHSRRSRRRDHRAHVDLIEITTAADAGTPGVLWLDHPTAFAYSLGGRPPLVVASTGLHALPISHQDAVLRHEKAHLRGRHHLLLALTQDLGTALPIVPLFRQAPIALRQLVELAADAAAASVCGPAAVRAALLAVDEGPGPQRALAMASRDVSHRLQCLAEPGRKRRRLSRFASHATAGVMSAVTSAAVGVSTFLVALAVACYAP